MVGALYIRKNGVYWNLEGVDPWDQERDARWYSGPWPVIVHPPCARWGRYWSGGSSAKVRRRLGDDDGCFKTALTIVRKWGGVLEHPEGSKAWEFYGLSRPPKAGGWIRADQFGGYTCCVEQGHYGHAARKATWLYAIHLTSFPELKWGKSEPMGKPTPYFHSAEKRKRAIRTGIVQRLSKNQREDTPIPFRDLLIRIAESSLKF